MITLNQKPAYNLLPAGQEIIYVVGEDTDLLTTETHAKIVAEVSVANDISFTDTIFTGEFKASPNAAGVCMFDFNQILENGVGTVYNGMFASDPTAFSKYQGLFYTQTQFYHSIHNIDNFAFGKENGKFVQISFFIEYLGAAGNTAIVERANMQIMAPMLFIFNGVLYDTDLLSFVNQLDFGYDMSSYFLQNIGDIGAGGFITNAPKTQNATMNDYGTVAFFNGVQESAFGFDVGYIPPPATGYKYTVKELQIIMRDSNDVQVGSTITMTNSQTNGGWSGQSGTGDDPTNSNVNTKILYAGVYPANLRAWSSDFQIQLGLGNMSYYTIIAYDQDSVPIGETYRINLITDCLYPPIRICWVNKFGTWDYYTFMKKSTRNLKTKRKEYTKLKGTWNNALYNPNIPTGGKQNYLVQTNETIKVNTDYITEAEAVWLEELFNSQQMFILNDYHFNLNVNNINRFVEPVILTTSSYKIKTKLNDKLIQYSFEFKRNTDRRTQRP
jgi:hypothetical protein